MGCGCLGPNNVSIPGSDQTQGSIHMNVGVKKVMQDDKNIKTICQNNNRAQIEANENKNSAKTLEDSRQHLDQSQICIKFPQKNQLVNSNKIQTSNLKIVMKGSENKKEEYGVDKKNKVDIMRQSTVVQQIPNIKTNSPQKKPQRSSNNSPMTNQLQKPRNTSVYKIQNPQHMTNGKNKKLSQKEIQQRNKLEINSQQIDQNINSRQEQQQILLYPVRILNQSTILINDKTQYPLQKQESVAENLNQSPLYVEVQDQITGNHSKKFKRTNSMFLGSQKTEDRNKQQPNGKDKKNSNKGMRDWDNKKQLNLASTMMKSTDSVMIQSQKTVLKSRRQ